MACDNTTEIRYCDESYPVYIQIMYIYVLSVLIVVGFSGNFVSLLVFEIQRRNKGSKTLGLLICLAVADSLFLSSNIFSHMLPTISKYVYLGQELAWSIHIRPYFTAMASIFQAFAAYMVFAVTLHRYLIITKPLVANIWMSGRKMAAMVLGLFLFSVGFNIPRFFELHVSGGSKGGARGTRAPPGGRNSFNFMQFLGKFGKIVCWRPPWELAPPPRGNPGSATACGHEMQ